MTEVGMSGNVWIQNEIFQVFWSLFAPPSYKRLRVPNMVTSQIILNKSGTRNSQ